MGRLEARWADLRLRVLYLGFGRLIVRPEAKKIRSERVGHGGTEGWMEGSMDA